MDSVIGDNFRILFCYPGEGREIWEAENLYRVKKNKDHGYLDYSDANVSDYIYDMMKCVLFAKLQETNTRNAETINELLNDIRIFQQHIYLVSVIENYNQHIELLRDDLDQVYAESKNISERFIDLFRG